MKTLIKFFAVSTLWITISSCNSNSDLADGYGNFEAIETTISSEVNGKLLKFSIQEGLTLDRGKVIGYIDTVQLALKKEQLVASKNVISSKY